MPQMSIQYATYIPMNIGDDGYNLQNIEYNS